MIGWEIRSCDWLNDRNILLVEKWRVVVQHFLTFHFFHPINTPPLSIQPLPSISTAFSSNHKPPFTQHPFPPSNQNNQNTPNYIPFHPSKNPSIPTTTHFSSIQPTQSQHPSPHIKHLHYQTPTKHPPNTHQTPTKHPSNAHQTPTKHPPNTHQTPIKQPSNTHQTPTKHPPGR